MLPCLGCFACGPAACDAIFSVGARHRSYTNTGCAIAVNPQDVWFRFTTAAAGQPGSSAAAITVTSGVAGQVRAFSSAGGAAGPFVPVGCSAASTTFGHRALVHAHITAGGRIWGILQPCVFGHPHHWTAAEREYLDAAVPLLLPVVQEYIRGLEMA